MSMLQWQSKFALRLCFNLTWLLDRPFSGYNLTQDSGWRHSLPSCCSAGQWERSWTLLLAEISSVVQHYPPPTSAAHTNGWRIWSEVLCMATPHSAGTSRYLCHWLQLEVRHIILVQLLCPRLLCLCLYRRQNQGHHSSSVFMLSLESRHL